MFRFFLPPLSLSLCFSLSITLLLSLYHFVSFFLLSLYHFVFFLPSNYHFVSFFPLSITLFLSPLYHYVCFSSLSLSVFFSLSTSTNNTCLQRTPSFSSLCVQGGDAADRDRIFKEFKDTKTKVLVTTNVLSRGIDVAQVNVVINYDPPLTQDSRRAVVPDISSYVHRSGRTGRFGRKGLNPSSLCVYSIVLTLNPHFSFLSGVVINFVYDAKTRKDFAVIEKVAMEKHGAPAAVRIANPDDDAELERVMKSQFD